MIDIEKTAKEIIETADRMELIIKNAVKVERNKNNT
jgi:hypothetical protein